MNPQLFFIYLAASLVIGYLGRAKTLKFWGHFLLSFLLSPVIGLLALGIEEWVCNGKCKKADPAPASAPAPAS